MSHTQRWLDYWAERLDMLANGAKLEEKLPLEFLDVLISRADAASSGGSPG